MSKRSVTLTAIVALAALSLGGISMATAGSERDSISWGFRDGVARSAPPAKGEADSEGAVGDESVRGSRGERIVLLQRGGEDFFFVDVLEEDFSPGDTYGFHDPLRDEEDTERAGELHVVCTAHFGEDVCGGTIRLGGRGKITFDGTVPVTAEPLNFLLAITGGTRDFREARGQMRVESIDDDTFRITLQLQS